MKIRFFIALTAILSAVGFGFSSNLETASGADRANFAAAAAARCAIPTFQNAFRQSKAVFVGEIVGDEKTGDVRAFDFKVEKYWKGGNAKRARVYVYETMRFQAPFEKGEKYLIYAPAGEDGKLRVGRCSRSRDFESAAEDLQKLGKGKIPR